MFDVCTGRSERHLPLDGAQESSMPELEVMLSRFVLS